MGEMDEIKRSDSTQKMKNPMLWVSASLDFGVSIALPLVLAIFLVKKFVHPNQQKVFFPFAILIALSTSTYMVWRSIQKITRK